MDLVFITQLIRSVAKELWQNRFFALGLGGIVAFSCLVYGMLWQESYEVKTTLYADRQNIIAPLLAGQAQVTKVEDRRQIVRDLMLSNRILETVVEEEGFLQGGASAASHAAKVSSLRKRVKVKNLGPNYIGVSFSDTDPDRAYRVVTRLVDFFITESSANKRSESKQAFLFIDRQANSYKEQLRDAEENLKNYKAANVDVSENRLAGSIDNLRTEISNLELDLEQSSTRVYTLKAQVEKEDRYLSQKAKANDYQQRLAEAVARLDNLRLSLTDNHPDVINLKQHIEGLKAAANTPSNASRDDIVAGIENPVYDELRSQLASAQVDYQSTKKRLDTMKVRLQDTYARGKQAAEKNAQLAELTRDYDVTRQLYEELLERKEKARLSMTLDQEGQGVSYKIQEPAKYPLSPTGMRFIHFVTAGGLLALAAPIGLAIGYVLLDPRIRFTGSLENNYGVPLLGVVPHAVSGMMRRKLIREMQVFGVLLLCVGLAYLGVAGIVELRG